MKSIDRLNDRLEGDRTPESIRAEQRAAYTKTLALLQEARVQAGRLAAGREMAMTRTKIDEALLWLGAYEKANA